MTIKGKHAGDYFVILCEQCERPVQCEYLATPGDRKVKATCEKCGTTTVKLDLPKWTGLP